MEVKASCIVVEGDLLLPLPAKKTRHGAIKGTRLRSCRAPAAYK